MPAILIAVALGAAGAFMLDPQQGRRRRALRGGPVSDDVLLGRLRARLGRHASHPHAVRVQARHGAVTLTGDVLAAEHLRLVRALRLVSGVKDVDDRLDVHPSAEGISALQGGTPRSGQPIELLQSRWAPGTRAIVGGAGAMLVLYGLARGGVAGVAAAAGGAALLARAKANRPLRQVMRKAARPEPRQEELAAA